MGCKYVLNPTQGDDIQQACDRLKLLSPVSFKKPDKHGEVKVSDAVSFYIHALGQRNRIADVLRGYGQNGDPIAEPKWRVGDGRKVAELG